MSPDSNQVHLIIGTQIHDVHDPYQTRYALIFPMNMKLTNNKKKGNIFL